MSFFDFMFLEQHALMKLDRYIDEHPSARMLGEGKCIRCGCCCYTRPCALNFEDVQNISKVFKLTPQEFFQKYLIVDKINSTYCLLPIRQEQTDVSGTFLSARRTYDMNTSCIFHDKNKGCTIQWIKPIGGREFECWNTEKQIAPLPEWSREELMELGWDGDTY